MPSLALSGKSSSIGLPHPYYNYDTIPQGYIRLLKIQRSSNFMNFEEPLNISLFSVPLHSRPDYAALSYTWGQPSPLPESDPVIFTTVQRCFPIRCNGKIILGTLNLRDALRHLRTVRNQQREQSSEQLSSRDPNVLRQADCFWIDAICIDQNNLWERSTQVSLMGAIYRQSLGVIIWLGNQDKYTRPAVEFMRELDSISPKAFGEAPTYHIQNLKGDKILAFMALVTRNWFSRIWTVQEAILAPKTTALCGGIYFNFDAILHCAVLLGNHGNSTSLTLKIEDALNNDPSAQLIRHKASSKSLESIKSICLCRNLIASGLMPDITNMIFINKACQATDERDRIYGILGITSEFQLGGKPTIIPDYTKSIRDVYIEATSAAFQSRNDLALLATCTDHKRSTIQNLPSWCPDYGANYSIAKRFGDRTRKWHLKLPWTFVPKIVVHQGSTLSIQGFRYDKIAEIANINPDSQRGRTNVGVSAPFRLASRINPSASEGLPPRRAKSRVEMLWRTLMFDEFEEESPAPSRAVCSFPQLVCMLLSIVLPREDIPVLSGALDRRIAQDHPIMIALSELEANINELIRLEPHSAGILPNIDRIRHHILHPATFKNGHHSLARGIVNYLKEVTKFEKSKSDGYAVADAQKLVGQAPHLDIAHILTDRNLLRTAKGTLGVGSLITEPEDEIWLLHGAYAPVVLRPLENRRYRFLGEAFVYGIMNGEVIPDCEDLVPVMIE